MNRRSFLKLVGSLPLVGWLVPKVRATPVEYRRHVDGIGEIPPLFKFIMSGELIEWPTKTHCEKLGLPVPECLIPGLIHLRVSEVASDWHMQSCLNTKPGDNYSFGDGVFTQECFSTEFHRSLREIGIQPQPIPPFGTKIEIRSVRYVSSAGFYCYGYNAKVLDKA